MTPEERKALEQILIETDRKSKHREREAHARRVALVRAMLEKIDKAEIGKDVDMDRY